MTGTVRGLTFDAERAKELTGSGFITATDLADSLVEKGVEFPAAHRAAGEVVSSLISKGRTLEGVTDEELKSLNDMFGEGSAASVSADASIARKASKGGTAPSSVEAQIEAAEGLLAGA